ncbi:MAG TPA: TolC family protein [Vicinamibacterales bacterium]|nr:TolC family protein [Vicinamibacterales bacterium]
MRALRVRWVGIAAGLMFCPGPATAQPGAAPPLTLQDAVAQAVAHYPAVRAAAAQVAAATASAAVARDAYLPRADLLWQTNRSTRNNISSLLLPQSVISGISGPVSAENADSIWNNAGGVLVAWEPIDFGYRSRMVRAADSARHAAGADEALTKLQVGAAAGDAFFSVLAANEAVRAAAAGVERARVLFDVVNARVQSGLRPGADGARAQAEVAAADAAAARAEQTAAVARAELARWLGTTPDQVAIESAPFLRLPDIGDTNANLATHPRLEAQAARLDGAKASESAAARTYVPRLFVDATAFARGAGAGANGAIGGIDGFDLTARNWAVGLNLTFPLLDAPVLRQRHALELARAEEATARLEQTRQDLNADFAKAQAALVAARRVATLTPAQVDAARAAEEQARARYGSGLGSIAEVAETERLLTDAEISNALAVLSVWRAQLGLAAARGDLAPLLAAAPTGGR